MRILKRGDATVVETLLYTKVLSRVVGEIRKKELANWPGNPDAARYVEALEQAQKQIWSRLPTDERLADRRQKLWIDFVDAPDVAFVAIGSVRDAGDERRSARAAPRAARAARALARLRAAQPAADRGRRVPPRRRGRRRAARAAALAGGAPLRGAGASARLRNRGAREGFEGMWGALLLRGRRR